MTIAERELTAEIVAAQDLEEAVRFLDVEPWIAQRLHQPEREVNSTFQIRADDGNAVMVHGTRVQHSSALGPFMGPLRLSKSTNVADLRAAAMKLTWQWALWNLPLGGAAGLIAANTDELSERELRLIFSQYASVSADLFGPAKDVLTPGTDLPDPVMGWMLSASGKHTVTSAGRLTGKPEVLQGVRRESIAARFVRCLLNVILRQQGSELAGRQVALVGFDNHAQNLASELELAGARVIAVTDSSGAVYRRTGLNIEMLRRHVSKEGVVFGFVEGEQISFEEMIQLPCDVLLLADGEELKFAHAAKMVVEVSGTVEAPSSGETVIVPSILGGFGLSFADYLEWRKATCGVYSDYEMPRMMMHLIRNTWRTVSEYAKEHGMSLQRAGTTLGIGRVAEAMRAM